MAPAQEATATGRKGEDLCCLLYVDDEAGYRHSFRSNMMLEGNYRVETAADGREALEKLKSFPAQIVLTDYTMPHMDGLALLEAIKQNYPEIFVLLLTGLDSTPHAVEAMKAGAYDYILKPFDFTRVKQVVERIVVHHHLLSTNRHHPPNLCQSDRFENILGKDPQMFALYEQINLVAQTHASVLIKGESGSGKELVAAAVHARSCRKHKPFVQINCAALSEELIGSELFGHEKGAFTGASSLKKGLFELADGGTIFLDEIGDIPLQTQIALLRVLESGTFHRVGGTCTLRVDARVICATNKDLQQAIRTKDFREDLYYRINVVSLTTPALRDRRMDIPLLANFFLEKFCTQTGKKLLGIAADAMALLQQYDWPGNVRELHHAIEHAVIFCRGRELVRDNFPAEIRHHLVDPATPLSLVTPSLQDAEAGLIRTVLVGQQWNLKKAAEELKIARGTLYSKMERYQIKRPLSP